MTTERGDRRRPYRARSEQRLRRPRGGRPLQTAGPSATRDRQQCHKGHRCAAASGGDAGRSPLPLPPRPTDSASSPARPRCSRRTAARVLLGLVRAWHVATDKASALSVRGQSVSKAAVASLLTPRQLDFLQQYSGVPGRPPGDRCSLLRHAERL